MPTGDHDLELDLDLDLDHEALLDQLRVSQRRLALAEAQLTLSKVAKAPTWIPAGGSAADTAERLRDLSPALDVLFHTSGLATFLLGTDDTILRANGAAGVLLGCALPDLPGRRLVETDAAGGIVEPDRRSAPARGGSFAATTYRRVDGTPVSALAVRLPLTDDDGVVVGQIGIAVPSQNLDADPSVLAELLTAAAGRPGREAPGPG